MPRLSAALSSGPLPANTRKGILESHPLKHGATAETAASPPKGDSGLAAAIAKAEKDYASRIQTYGPRLFRQPDGSLGPDRPPNNHYSVASRKKWAHIVKYCRENAGVDDVIKQGFSHRWNVKVDRKEHLAVMEALHLAPETNAEGQWMDLDPNKSDNPLDDPTHVLNQLKSKMHDKYEW